MSILAKLLTGTFGGIVGFWDKQLDKSEKKLNETLVSQMRAEFPALTILQGTYPCAEQAYLHQSIDIASPEHGFLVFHRCRNIWYVASTDGAVHEELGNPPAGSVAAGIVIWAERLDGHNLLRRKVAEWTAIHEAAGLETGQVVQKILESSYSELWMVAKEMGGALVSSSFGSDWLGGKPPSNLTEKRFFEYLESNRGLLSSEGVSDDDIRTYWDASGLEKAVQWLELNWLRVGATVSALQSGIWNSSEEGMALSSERAKRACPNYAGLAYVIEEGPSPSRPLANELFPRTFGVFVDAFKKGGIVGLEKLSKAHGSANEYVREELL